MKKFALVVASFLTLFSFNLMAGEWLLIDSQGNRHFFEQVTGIWNDSLNVGTADNMQRWALNDIITLQAPRKSQVLKGMVIGMGAGAATGLAMGAASAEGEDTPLQVFASALVGSVGAIGGTVVGGVAGYALPRTTHVNLMGKSVAEKRVAITRLLENHYR